MFRKFIKYILSVESLSSAAVWLLFGVGYAAITPPFLKSLPRGVFIGACIVCLIAASRQLTAYTAYLADRKKAKKTHDEQYLQNITKNYHDIKNPWIPAGILLLLLAGILFLLFH